MSDKVVSRIAWILSFLLANIVVSYLSAWLGFSRYGGMGVGYLIGVALMTMLVKKLFLSARFLGTDSKEGEAVVPRKDRFIEKEDLEDYQPVRSNAIHGDPSVSISEVQEDASEQTTVEVVEHNDDPLPEYQPSYTKPSKPKREPSGPNPVAAYFAENTLAKVGGVLIFVAVLAFLSVAYTRIGPVARFLLTFIVAAIIYAIGAWLHRKGHRHEGSIVLGVSILIMYLDIIYASRIDAIASIFGQNYPFFVLFFLVLAVAFGMMTGLIYKSRVLFIFSSAAAYLNPFLIPGIGASGPLMSLLYALVISVGLLGGASYFFKKEDEAEQVLGTWLLWISLIGGSILMLLVPMGAGEVAHWVMKLVFIVVLFLVGTAVSYMSPRKEDLLLTIYGSFLVFFVYLIGLGTTGSIVGNTLLTVLMLVVFLLFGFFGLIFSTIFTIGAFAWAMVIPFILGLAGLWMGIWSSVFVMIALLIGAGILTIIFGSKLLSSGILKMLIGVIGVFSIVVTFSMTDLDKISTLEAHWMIGVSAVFLVVSYVVAQLRNLSHITSVTTFAAVVILLACIHLQKVEPSLVMNLGLIVASLFALCGLIQSSILIARDGDESDILATSIIGALFVLGEYIYFGGFVSNWGMKLGFVLLGIAFVYGAWGVGLLGSLKSKLENKPQQLQTLKVASVLLMAVALSAVTISVVYLFESQYVRILVWLVEVTVLLFVTSVYNTYLLLWGGVIIHAIGIVLFLQGMDSFSLEKTKVFLGITGIVMIANGYFSSRLKDGWRDIWSHITGLSIGFWMVGLLFAADASFTKISAFFWLFGLLIWTLYSASTITMTKITRGWILIYWTVFAVVSTYMVQQWEKGMLEAIVLIMPFLFIIPVIYLEPRGQKGLKVPAALIAGLYAFIFTSFWIHETFDNIYVLTGFWGLWALALFSVAAVFGKSVFRSFGLYVYCLILGKIIFVDLPQIFTQNSESGVYIGIGVVLAMGVVSIGLSMLYTRSFGEGALKRDFALDGFKK